MKRIFSIFSCLILVVAFIAAPVSADDISDLQDGKLLNLLDYGNSLESDTNYQKFTNNVSFNYKMPYSDTVTYVDVVIHYWSSNNDLSSVKLLRQNAVESDLTLVKISANVYRAYGTFSRAFNTIGVQLFSSDPSVTSYATIVSFNIGLFNRSEFNLNGSATVYTANDTQNVIHRPSSLGTVFWELEDNMNDSYFLLDLMCDEDKWVQYDFIDFVFSLNVNSIDSISVLMDDRIVPFETYYLDNSNAEGALYTVVVRVDLRNINRTLDIPVVTVRGVSHWVNTNSLIIHDIVGHVAYVYENPVIYWFKNTFSSIKTGFSDIASKLTSGFNSVVAAITGFSSEFSAKMVTLFSKIGTGFNNVISTLGQKIDTFASDFSARMVTLYNKLGTGFQSVVAAITGDGSAADEAGQVMEEAGNDLDDIGNAFDQVETPDIDAAALTGNFTNFSPSGLTVLASITNNSYVTSLLALVFTFALCAYIFFGRKR